MDTKILAHRESVRSLAEKFDNLSFPAIRVMEVCGTHTTAIARSGLRTVIPRKIRLLSGPGCPVCVTSGGDIDRVLELARKPNVTILSFGDMIHVPGSQESLEQIRALKNNVKIVYSPADALSYARQRPAEECVFAGVGFETTIPSVAATVISARLQNVRNFFVAPMFKLVPPALRAILEIKERRIDGFILPGHVSTVIGSEPYQFIAEEFGVPGVISGFEPADILESLADLLALILGKVPAIRNQYVRCVTPGGNRTAVALMEKVFQVSDAVWRAIGALPGSGLSFRQEFSEFDAFQRFSVPEFPTLDPKGCRCGQILLGMCGPLDCPLFRKICNPSNPVGPCMVSSEGACSALYHYGEDSL